MSEDLTEKELQELDEKIEALSDADVLDQIDCLSKLYELQLLQDDLNENFLDYHAFWTDILAKETLKRGI